MNFCPLHGIQLHRVSSTRLLGGACRQGENARVRRSPPSSKSKGAFLSVHRRRPCRSLPPLKSVGPLRPSVMGLAAQTERMRSSGSAQASAVGCAPVSQRGSVMRVNAQLLTGLWHARSRPCCSRASRAASCELLAGSFSRENRHNKGVSADGIGTQIGPLGVCVFRKSYRIGNTVKMSNSAQFCTFLPIRKRKQ